MHVLQLFRTPTQEKRKRTLTKIAKGQMAKSTCEYRNNVLELSSDAVKLATRWRPLGP